MSEAQCLTNEEIDLKVSELSSEITVEGDEKGNLRR